MQGHITEPYNASKKHYAVEVALAANTPVKAIAAGTVILADWTPTNGNVIIVRHNDGIISVYKKAASLTKEQGDIVKSGEVLAQAGTQLRFELWKDGYPINPTQFIDFE
ncbi:MAG: M23 family metallopeptidase [Bacteroidota bacterium]